jgi:hypothetical protein
MKDQIYSQIIFVVIDLLMLWNIIYAFKRGKIIRFFGGPYGFGSTESRAEHPIFFWFTVIVTIAFFVFYNAMLVGLIHHHLF